MRKRKGSVLAWDGSQLDDHGFFAYQQLERYGVGFRV